MKSLPLQQKIKVFSCTKAGILQEECQWTVWEMVTSLLTMEAASMLFFSFHCWIFSLDIRNTTLFTFIYIKKNLFWTFVSRFVFTVLAAVGEIPTLRKASWRRHWRKSIPGDISPLQNLLPDRYHVKAHSARSKFVWIKNEKKNHEQFMNQFKSFANSMSAHPIKSCSKVASLAYAWKCTEITAYAAFACKHKPTSLVCSENKILIKIKPKLVKLKFSA